jgi:hypothetical protein
MTHRTRLCHFVIDVSDLDSGASFWSAALGAVDEPLPEISRGVYRHLRLPDSEIAVLLQKTNDKKVSKERMHLDLEADDVEADVRRLEALGATRLDHQQERGFDFWVMRDPWENEFRILQSDDPNIIAQREPLGGKLTTAYMANYSTRVGVTVLQASYTKWLIFGVALPLLPLAAGVLAAFLNPLGNGGLTFTSLNHLLGDGELLVIATVIAAAVIGDLLFEISDYNDATSWIRAGTLCAVSLLIVVVSVLIYGLVAVHGQSSIYTGHTSASVLSMIMFLASFGVGAYAVWFSAMQSIRHVQAEPST